MDTSANIVHGHGPVILWIIDAIEFYRACIGLAWLTVLLDDEPPWPAAYAPLRVQCVHLI